MKQRNMVQCSVNDVYLGKERKKEKKQNRNRHGNHSRDNRSFH